MVNRYLNPTLLQYQSQFVPQQIPWELLQGSAERKQQKRDEFGASALKLGDINEAGIDYTVDHYGNTLDIGDLSASRQEVSDFKNDLIKFNEEFASSELSKDHVVKYGELQKKYNEIAAKNKFREKRAADIKAIHDQRIKDKVNPGDVRGVWYQQELMKVANDPTGKYTPQLQAHQDVFDESKFVVDATSLINSEVQSLSAEAQGEYLRAYKKTGRLPEKVERVFTGAFKSNQELQQLIKMEATDLAIRLSGGQSDDITQKIQFEDGNGNIKEMTAYEAVYENKYQNMLSQAMGRVSSDGSTSIASNASHWKGLEWAEAHPLPLVSENLTKTKSEFELSFDVAKKYDDYKKGGIRLMEVQGQLAALSKNLNINNAGEYKKLLDEQEMLLNQKASMEGSIHNVKTNNFEALKNSAYELIDKRVQDAHKTIAAYERDRNKGIIDESGMLEKNYLQAKKDAKTLLYQKDAILKASNYTKLEDLMYGTSVYNDYEGQVKELLVNQPTETEYSGFTVSDKGDIKNLTNLLYSTNNYTGLNGEAVNFEGKPRGQVQIGFTADGDPFVTIVEDVERWGTVEPESKTVMLDSKNPAVEGMLNKMVSNATKVYNMSGGTDQNAKHVMDRGIFSLATKKNIVTNSPNAKSNLGAWMGDVQASAEGTMHYMTLQVPNEEGIYEDIIITAHKSKDDGVDVQVGKKIDNKIEYFDPFKGTAKQGLTHFNDVNHAVTELLNLQ